MKHDDPQDAATAAMAAVAGLARQTEILARDLAAMKKGLQLTASAGELARLAQVVTELSETVATPPRKRPEPEAVPSWLVLAMDANTAQTVLADLFSWLRDVYLRYADAARLPQCWLWHPDVVEELVWLMHAWIAAYQGDDASVKTAGDWHDRHRPGVVARIAKYAGGCDLGKHTTGEATGAVEVPAADAAEAIVAWWTGNRDQAGPEPTPDQITAARAALNRRTQIGEL
jgi:hypothetical protein